MDIGLVVELPCLEHKRAASLDIGLVVDGIEPQELLLLGDIEGFGNQLKLGFRRHFVGCIEVA